MSDTDGNANYELFRDCLSAAIVRAAPTPAPAPTPRPKRRRRAKTRASEETSVSSVSASASGTGTDPDRDAEELADFIDYLASEMFDSFPDDLRELSLGCWRDSPYMQTQYALPLTAEDSFSDMNLPLTITETLRTYNLIAPDPTLDSPLPATAERFLIPVLTGYITSLTTPPPADYSTRADACEICGRWWIPLSYHHLIPRFVHDKAVKRGWHRKEDLQNVAWLCGACHRFVHHFKGHEELARDYHTVELLLEAEEVQRWAAWVSKLRWKGGGVRGRRW
ncbi:hypothetical protein ACRE_086360 [Hapsidospora chrysogenum ATCC 11550]|uniref:HNH domain-containing protein n=1 Tax=Hapsidospora chrysogenum (strain ATCC 11550 / CBS 779.69 / DSM 880 / IAM 14645 / JCM 23072 / IMI 49137) TaxID=857340 RepID=A0A086SU82_HAPC1|nr:hypothetical protein ACRE_086360 [Hapsidospora chrysogenum ATCC 11550]